MLEILWTSQFRKDYKRLKKRNAPLEALERVIDLLAMGEPLPPEYRDHALSGTYAGYRDCHIAPDWILLYKIDHGRLVLTLVRTGTHSDLF